MDENRLEILDAENIDFNPDTLNQSTDEDEVNDDKVNNNNSQDDDSQEKDELQEEDESQKEDIKINEIAGEDSSLFYNFLHILDDLFVYSRTVIENNCFNLSDNIDFNLVYPNIYIGNYSTSTNLELLQGLGITHIITVLPTFNPPFPDKFTYLHIQAYDDETQHLEHFFQQTNSFISNVLTQKGKVLIHCMVGRSRSVSIFIAFLIYIIQGYFSQTLVDITNNNDVSNQIEFNKISGKHNNIITDVLPSTRKKQNNQENNHQYENNKINQLETIHKFNQDEEISRVKYMPPEFENKYSLFMAYKKEIMLKEIDKCIKTYSTLLTSNKITSDKNNNETPTLELELEQKEQFYSTILAYVKKYRNIACPNPYFEKQLKTFLFSN